LLRAVTGPGLHASVVHERPQEADPGRELGFVESALRHYLGAPEDRFVSVSLHSSGGAAWSPRLRQFLDGRVRFVVALASGEFLVVDSADELITRIFGLPAGFWAGIIGFVVAAVAVLAVLRETLPLSHLAGLVDRFGIALDSTPVPERGAREVRALIRAFNQMQSRIATLVKARTFIIGAIAHDLRTYLTRLRLRIETLPDVAIRERAARDVEDMEALLEEALGFARASFIGAESEPVDLVELVASECDERRGTGAPVSATLPPMPVIVAGTATALARVVSNLVDNALN